MDRYREMEILAMTPANRVVLLYTHLLVNLKQARVFLERGDIGARGERLVKAEEIVHELAVSLDRDGGGELATRLASLYVWLLREFVAIHSRPDMARLDAVIRVVTDLHEAWSGAAAQLGETPAAGTTG